MPETGNPYANTQAMYAVHSMFRREFALMPGLIGAVPPVDARRVRAVADHISLMCDMLHHHHAAEDAVLWPRLLARVPKELDTVVHLAEGHHQAIDDLLAEVGKRAEAWREDPTADSGSSLALALRRLAVKAFEHMGLEERLVLPLVERHIFASEWAEMEEHAVGAPTPEELVLLVGMVMYEAGRDWIPEDLPEQVIDPAPQVYAAHAEFLYGTKTPPRSTELAIGTPLVGVASEVV